MVGGRLNQLEEELRRLRHVEMVNLQLRTQVAKLVAENKTLREAFSILLTSRTPSAGPQFAAVPPRLSAVVLDRRKRGAAPEGFGVATATRDSRRGGGGMRSASVPKGLTPRQPQPMPTAAPKGLMQPMPTAAPSEVGSDCRAAGGGLCGVFSAASIRARSADEGVRDARSVAGACRDRSFSPDPEEPLNCSSTSSIPSYLPLRIVNGKVIFPGFPCSEGLSEVGDQAVGKSVGGEGTQQSPSCPSLRLGGISSSQSCHGDGSMTPPSSPLASSAHCVMSPVSCTTAGSPPHSPSSGVEGMDNVTAAPLSPPPPAPTTVHRSGSQSILAMLPSSTLPMPNHKPPFHPQPQLRLGTDSGRDENFYQSFNDGFAEEFVMFC